MKAHLVIASVVWLSASLAFAATNENLTARQRLIKEHREFILRTGGYVVKPDPGNRAVVILNAQKKVPDVAFRRALGYLRFAAKINFDLRKAETAPASLAKAVKDANAAVLVTVVDDPTSSSPILLSPDEHWAKVNVSAITSDKPGEAVLNSRFRLLLTRAICFSCGGGASKHKNVPTLPIKTVSDYDGLMAESISTDQVSFMNAYLNELGSRPIVRVTYDIACQQGWAAVPTNKVQQAIWDRIHKMPTEPLKIKPETKKVEK